MTPPDLPPHVRSRQDLEGVLAQVTNYEETRPRLKERPSFRLDRVRAMLASLGDPQIGPRTVHIAGSKGKGSVARMIDAVLRRGAPGGPVGLFTSPHLEDLAERIQVDGRSASDADLAAGGDALLPWIRRTQGTADAPSFFEILTGMAWWIFREHGCRDVVLETGLGGRLDATNVCRPAAVIITAVEREHVDILGPTLGAIAAEKAGIVKRGVPTATSAEGEALAVVAERAATLHAPLAVVGQDLEILRAASSPGPKTEVEVRLRPGAAPLAISMPVAGTHHAANVALAAWAASRLGVGDDVLTRALADVRLPGIVEPLGRDPEVIADGAHTVASATATRAAVEACWPGRGIVLVLAFLQGKEVDDVLDVLLPGVKAAVTTELPTPRRVAAADLRDRVRARAAPDVAVEARTDPAHALAEARRRAGRHDVVLATGSVRLAGAIRALA